MSDLKCTKCGIERSYADANIADLHGTCGKGNDGRPSEVEVEGGYTKYVYGGEEHDWVEA